MAQNGNIMEIWGDLMLLFFDFRGVISQFPLKNGGE